MKKPKEAIDLSTLPKVNIGTSTLILDFKNNERRAKVIEVLFKMPEKIVKIFSRDHIIEYAKENKIYIDPTEGKKPNPKDPPIEKKEISPEELGKSASGLITDASVQYRKDKKALMDNIEALKKQKEDAIAYWDNPPPQDPKKKPDKKQPPQPNDIVIPVIDEMDMEFMVVLYNYPMNSKEYAALEKESIVLNNIHLCTEIEDSHEELKTEGNVGNEKNKKPQPVKESKAPIDNQIIKYFYIPADYDAKAHYSNLQMGRIESDYLSKMRMTLFDKDDFAFKVSDDPKRSFFNVYQEEYVARMKETFKFYLYYLKWLELNKFINLGTDPQVFTIEHVKELLNSCDYEPKDCEHQSIGNILISYFAGFDDKMENETKMESEQGIQDQKDQQDQQQQQQQLQQDQQEEKVDETPVEIMVVPEINKLFDDINLDIEDDYNPKIQIQESQENIEESQPNKIDNVIEDQEKADEEQLISKKSTKQLEQQIQKKDTKQQDMEFNQNQDQDQDQDQEQQELRNELEQIENPQSQEKVLQNEEAEGEVEPQQLDEQLIQNKSTKQQEKEQQEVDQNAQKDEITNEGSHHTQYSNPDIYLDYERLIISEHDYYMKRSIEAKNEQAYIFQIEKHFNNFRSLPGIERPPTLSPVEEHLRKAKRSKVYPFLSSGISIPVYERYEILHKFEEEMKIVFPDRQFDFGNRIYQETMNKDILSQRISRLMMFNPERKIVYNERNDTMLLTFYYRCPPNRVDRKLHQYKYLSKPDFENWVKFFKPVFNTCKATNVKNSDEGVEEEKKEVEQGHDNKDNATINANAYSNANANTNMNHQSQSGNLQSQTGLEGQQASNSAVQNTVLFQKKQNSPFALLSSVFDGNMYLANDTYLGNVKEKIKYMFPSDNGIFIKKVIENGIFSSYSSFVLKDELIFGIRKGSEDQKEFWYHYDNNAILTASYYNKEVFTNIALPNGLNIQILPNGQIAQKLNDEEEYRIIASKSTVMKYLPKNEINVLYASGNYSQIKDNKSINVNNKGLRLERNLETNILKELSPIPVTIQSDTDSQSKTLIREDGVIYIKYPDKTCLTIHNDTTKIYSYHEDADGNIRYTIEHDLYATVNTYICGKTKTFKGNNILNEVFKLSTDGFVYQINMPDRNEIYIYKQHNEKSESLTMTVTLIVNHDGSIIRIREDGEIDIISPSERAKLKETNQFNEYLFGSAELPQSQNRIDGIYTCVLKEGKIFTVDKDNNLFEIYDDGFANCVLSQYEPINYDELNQQEGEEGEGKSQIIQQGEDNVSSQLPEENKAEEVPRSNDQSQSNEIDPNVDNNNTQLERPKSPEYTEEMQNNNLDEQNRPIYQPTTNFITPRLFVIENDFSGYELLTQDQMSNFKYLKSNDARHTKYIKEELTQDFTSHFWISKYFSIKEGIKETHYINDIHIPSNLEKFTRLPNEATYHQQEFYFYRNVIESQTFTEEFRQEVVKAKEESQLHFEKRNAEWIFGTYKDKTVFQNEIELNDKLLRKMLLDRQEEDLRFTYESMKKQIKIDKGFVELIPNESVLFNIQEFVDLKESRKIQENLDFRIYPLNQNIVAPTEIKAIVNDNETKAIDSMGNNSVMTQTKKKPLLDANTKEVKFFNNYFDTDKGQQLFNVHPHIPYVKQLKIDSNEQLAQSLIDKALAEQEEEENQINLDNGIDANNKQSSPVVYLNEDQGVNEINDKNETIKNNKRVASLYKQSKVLNKIQDEYQHQRAKDWIESKSIKYRCNGELRQTNPKLPNYIKPTFPQAEFNEDYIYLEKLTERRVKTSSVANRIYFNAPTVEEIRKSGQHDFLLEAIENKRTPEEMMERLNLMITSELCDPLNKQLKIEPVALDFGRVCANKMYQMYFKLRNDDNMTNRVQIRHSPENNHIKIENFIGGKVVPGDTKKIKVVINTQDQMGRFTEIVEVQTKSFLYKIPIKAYILSEEEYNDNQCKQEGREPYSKTYPVGDQKFKCDPIKIVLPKIRELEEIERKKNTEKQLNANNEDSDMFINSDNQNQKLPPI